MSMTILLVDDDAAFRESVRQMLVFAEYEVLEAEDGIKALELLKSEVVDILLTDILMPDMEGVELRSKALKLKPELKVIGLTGGGLMSAESVTGMAERFFHVFLRKPFDCRELLDGITTVENWVGPEPVVSKQ